MQELNKTWPTLHNSFYLLTESMWQNSIGRFYLNWQPCCCSASARIKTPHLRANTKESVQLYHISLSSKDYNL